MNSHKTRSLIELTKNLKGALLSILGILFVLSSFTNIPAAEKSDINVSVRYGYDQYAKYGRYLPMDITIENNGENFSGYIQTYASKAGKNIAYEKAVTVQAHKTIKVSITIPVVDNSGYLNVKLLNKHKAQVWTKQYTLNLGNYDKLMYVGVLSDNFTALDYLNYYGTKVFHLDESSLPSDQLGLDLLDVLVINQYNTTKLSIDQITAIKDWVNSGGNLILGTGENEEEVLSNIGNQYGITSINSGRNLTFTFGTNKSGLKDLSSKILDYEEARRIYLENLTSQNEMLTSYGLKAITIPQNQGTVWTKEELNKLKLEELTKVVSDFNISDGINVYSQENNQLFTVKKQGLGKIEIFHFDLGLSKENKATGLSIITAIRSNISDTKKVVLDNELYGAYMSNGISNFISHTSDKTKPNILYYTLIIIAYVLISGPILYIILKKLDKSNWYFRFIVTLSLLFMGIIYLMGHNTRIGKPYMEFIKVSEFDDEDTLTNKLYFSITGNSNRDVDVNLSQNYDIKELSQSIPFISDYRSLKNFDPTTINSIITYKDSETELKLTGLPAFSPLQYQLTKVETAKNKISATITNIGYGLAGTIKNNFNFDINNAILISNGYLVGLGSIKASEEVTLSGKYAKYINVRDELYQKEVLEKLTQTKDMYEEAESNRLNSVLQFFLEKDISDLSEGNYLLGYKTNDVENNHEDGTLGDDIMADISKDYDVYSTEVVKLPLEVNYTTGLESFVPSIDPYIVPSDSYYNKYYQARYLSTPETTLTYHFPANDKIIRFSFLRNQNDENISEYLSKFTGTIGFLNHKTGAYDAVFTSGYSESINNPDNYLTEDNTLTVKFSTDMSLKSFNIVLPHISYWKEADHVRN